MSSVLPCERPGESFPDEDLLRSGRELIRTEAAELLRAADKRIRIKNPVFLE